MDTTPLIPTFNAPADHQAILARLTPPRTTQTPSSQTLQKTVASIIEKVRTDGDPALHHYTQTFDALDDPSTYTLPLTQADFTELKQNPIEPALQQAIETAITNIEAFHRKQIVSSIDHTGTHGEKLSLRASPLESVGLYIPGGRAGTTPLISTLIMNAIPAQLAGVSRLVVTTPPTRKGTLAPILLYTLKRLGLREVYKIGGAQAIAALAYGTASIAPVDFISGPGNSYVTEAKRQVFGTVGIESLSGSSELVILSDGTLPAEHVASDMLSQAEHAGDEMICLITSSRAHGETVLRTAQRFLQNLSRKDLITKSLTTRGALVLVKDLSAAYPLINALAPEHLELLVENPRTHLKFIRHAGAIFLGAWSSEPIGDYIAGCNHILPTTSTARFASPLTVHHFCKFTNIIEYTEAAFRAYAPHAAALANAETLSAHHHALTIRMSSPNH